MRTSLTQQMQNSLTYLNQSSNKLGDLQTRAISGKRILRASDDVPGTGRALSLKSDIKNNEQLSNNVTVSQPMLKTTQAALSDLVKSMTQIKEKASKSINSALSDVERKQLGVDLDNILSVMANAANTKHMDKYVFSGTATTTQPLADAVGASPYTYAGNTNVRQTQILSNVATPINIPGSSVFNFDGSAGPGVPDIFTMVTQLRDAVVAGDSTAVSSQLKNVDANLDNLLSCSAQVGSWVARMDSAKTVLSDSNLQLKEMLSDTQDVDLADAIVQLKTQENVYQASLSISSQILNISLASSKSS